MNYIVSLIVVLFFSLLTWSINGEVIGLWGFDEQTGQVAKDNSPLENDGKIAADVKRVPGKFGRAVVNSVQVSTEIKITQGAVIPI